MKEMDSKNLTPKQGDLIKDKSESVVDFIRSKAKNSCWNKGFDENDSVLFPNDDKKLLLRGNFHIPAEEQILYVRDTSFWSVNNQGLVLTDKRIYLIQDNDDPENEITIPLSNIEKVTYKELVLSFWDGTDQPYTINISYFVKNVYDERAQIGEFLAKLFTEMVKLVVDPANVILEEFYEIRKEKGEEAAIQYAEQKVQSDSNAAILYIEIAQYFRLKGDYDKALSYANEGIRNMISGSCAELQLREISGEAYEKLGNYDFARRVLYYAFIASKDYMKSCSGEQKLEDSVSSLFDEADTKFSEHFLELPYKDRKVVMPVNELNRVNEIDTFAMLSINRNTGIDYPVGHPIANQLYVGHPYIPSKYLPLDTYQLELVEDKVREFCFLAQCLGAKEISIECLTTNNSNQSHKSRNDKNGNIANKVGTEYGSSRSMQMIETLSHSISLHQTYVPNKPPFLPTDMVWYSNEPSWQRLYVQRMNGGLTSHEERIETRKSQMINSDELKNLKNDVSIFYADLNIEMSSEEENKYSIQENAVLAIKVNFASLNEIQLNSNIGKENIVNTKLDIADSKEQFTKEEREYLNEFEECITESNGNISGVERRLLDKYRSRLGITEKRAAELEDIVAKKTMPITEEEREYMNEIKECIASNGNISSCERRLLNKLREQLGIDKERAEELERIVVA